jgi:2-aminoethylphosphonate-pyruvate transaminase
MHTLLNLFSTAKPSVSNHTNILLTPVPLTTSDSVRQAANIDIGSRDPEFCKVVKEIRYGLLELATGKTNDKEHDIILMQGSGTFGVESVINSTIGPLDTLLIIENGAYGKRVVEMCTKANIKHHVLSFPTNMAVDVSEVDKILQLNHHITHVFVVHSETTSGIVNPINELGQLINDYRVDEKRDIVFIIDAMSSFGGIPLNVYNCYASFVISSSNKCIQGLPGFSFIIANINSLKNHGWHAKTHSLDILDQWNVMTRTSQFRFTPPRQALRELVEEGGPNSRYIRYSKNQVTLSNGMQKLGFKLYITDPNIQGPIITTFMYPENGTPLGEWFNFDDFYNRLVNAGFTIYAGKMIPDTFRIGSIGDIDSNDIERFISSVENILFTS